MEELKSKFAQIESNGTEVEQQAQSVLDMPRGEDKDHVTIFDVVMEVYAKKDEFTKKIADLKTEITNAVRLTMGQKADSASGLKKAAHELLINLAQLETKFNTGLSPILSEIEGLKTEMGVKAMITKLEKAKEKVAENLGDESTQDANAEEFDIEEAKTRILKCEGAQQAINEVKAFHQMLLPPGGKGIPKAQFAIRMTKLAPQTQAIQQLESKVFKAKSVGTIVIQRVEATAMLAEVQKEVTPAEAMP